MNFTDLKQDTPRLAVMYRPAADGKGEDYQWGILPGLPMPALIGYVTRVQLWLLDNVAQRSLTNRCPQMVFVVAWDGEAFQWWVHKDIPTDSLVGMLEIVKGMLATSKLGQRSAENRIQLYSTSDIPPIKAR